MIGSYERLLSFGNQVGLSDGLWIFAKRADGKGDLVHQLQRLQSGRLINIQIVKKDSGPLAF